jgi:ABC-type transporter Mla subunit MlaD
MPEFERISTYELSQALKAIQGIVERLPKAISIELDETANGAIEDTIGKINRTYETCKQFEATLNAKQTELYKFIDDTFAKVRDAREAMRKRMDELPSVTIAFDRNELRDIEMLVDTAAKFSHLSDAAWARVIELAKAVSAK